MVREMKLASFRHGTKESYGVVIDGDIVDVGQALGSRYPRLRAVIAADRLSEVKKIAARRFPTIPLDDVTLLPVIPDADKVFGIGRNYRAHVREMADDIPQHPRVFLKHMSALVGHGQPLVRPRVSANFDYEGELAVIIGRPGRHIDRTDALSHVAGYTCFNDGSLRDFQRHSLIAGKNFYRSGSIGPWIVTADEIGDPTKLVLITRLNGKEVQRSNTDALIFDIPFLISYLSSWTILMPGDVIATGTPAGTGFKRNPPLWMKPGDVVEVEISGIGILRNPVIDESEDCAVSSKK
jgi:2-keto-4-pentenoate hydratase/2-oxohepta-3-ene-1,7-dioic acid hydratase in catechol pathway